MQAKAKDLTFLASEAIVRVPFFQRPYVWEKENWEELLEDLAQTGRRHFLGSLILKQLAVASGSPKEVLVVDGQQRLTTLSLLIKALYDALPNELRENAAETVRSVLFHKGVFDKAFKVKIQHSRVDRDAYEMVMRAGLDAPAFVTRTGPKSRVVGCYQYFCEQLATWPEERRQRLFAHLLDQQNKMIVVIDLLGDDNEQAIFDTINSAGVRLSAADIIKNALFQRALELMPESDALARYAELWEQPFLGDPDVIAFWNAERVTGRLKRDNMEILLHAIAVLKGFYDPSEHLMAELADRYKVEIAKLSTPELLVDFATEIRDYASLYREHFVPLDATRFAFGDHLLRLFHVLDVFQVSTLHPFVLYALGRPPEVSAPLLRELERFVVRRVVAGHELRSFNKLTKDLVLRPELLGDPMGETSDADVRAGLERMSNQTAAVLLFWVELRRRANDPKFDERELAYNYTLEHVMPQKWGHHWPVQARLRGDGSEMTTEEAAKDRSEKVYWLGNMTLLSGNLNASLSNSEFAKKVKGDGRKKGMGVYASLSITSRDIVAPFDAGDAVWDEAKIAARTDALEEEVLAIWGRAGA